MALAGPAPISQSAQLRLRGTALCSRPPSSGPASEQLPGLGGDRAVIDAPRPLVVVLRLEKKTSGGGGAQKGEREGFRGDGVELRLLSFLHSNPSNLVGCDSLLSVPAVQPEPLPGPLLMSYP